jgi:hypothetical protein
MADWDRRTPWRQGHVLSAETVAALGLVADQDPVDLLIVVVSHDCDLAQDPTVEPAVEVIIGCRVGKADGNLTHAKNPRRLHMLGADSGAATCVELKATARRSIAKRDLACHLPSDKVRIDPPARITLQHWLAALVTGGQPFPTHSTTTLISRELLTASRRFSKRAHEKNLSSAPPRVAVIVGLGSSAN